MHVGTEFPRLYDGDFLFAFSDDVFVELVGKRGVAGAIERRAVALVAVGVQRKLRNEQEFTIHILDRKIRLAELKKKNTECKHLTDEPVSDFAGITFAHTDENQVTLANLAYSFAFNIYLGVLDSLYQEFHITQIDAKHA